MTITSLAQLTIGAADLGAAFLFLYGLKRMSSPVTAPSGIAFAGIGMLVAVFASFLFVFDVAPAANPHLLVNAGPGVGPPSTGGRPAAVAPAVIRHPASRGRGPSGARAPADLDWRSPTDQSPILAERANARPTGAAETVYDGRLPHSPSTSTVCLDDHQWRLNLNRGEHQCAA